MIKEDAFFFRTDSRPLFGVLYHPSRTGKEYTEDQTAGRALLVCDSLFEEKFWCERVFANMGRELAEQGITVFVFDYYGYANSTGRSEDVSAESIERDIGDACDFLKARGIRSISLLGVRWGAAPACNIASGRSDVDSLFLIKPVAGWRKQLKQSLRSNVAGQYAIFKKAVMTREEIINRLLSGEDCTYAGYRMNNIEGYIISKELWRQSEDMTVPDRLPQHIKDVTVIHIPEREGKKPLEEETMVTRFKQNGVNCELLDIPDDNAFWVNNRIFTSETPRLYEELIKRIRELPPSGPEEREKDAAGEEQANKEWQTSRTITNGEIGERVVELENSEGNRLYGILYSPRGESRDTAYIFTHGGLIGMNGAFRFNTRAARQLAENGYHSLCCDTHGIGRSAGKIENVEQRVLFRRICVGLFSGDVIGSVNFLRDTTGERKVVLMGVCGGAITNIIAQGECADIDTSLLLSVPVMLPSLRYGEVRMSEGFARFYLGLYLRKIFNPGAWWRFITFKSDHRTIFKAFYILFGGLLSRLKIAPNKSAGEKTGSGKAGRNRGDGGSKKAPAGEKGEKPRSGVSVAVPGAGDDLQFNDKFLEAFRGVARNGGRAVFVFGENDNFRWEFYEEFKNKMPEEFEKYGQEFSIEEIQHANHMYTLREWQDRIIQYCIDNLG